MTIEDIKLKLEEILIPTRFIHSLNVMNMAQKLALKYGEDIGKAAIAGLLHDCARDIKREELFTLCEKYDINVDEVSKIQPELLHGPIGANLAREVYGVSDEEIIKSIYYHTTGCEGMTIFEKIIYIADYIELDRNFQGVTEVREMAFIDINKSMILSLDKTIKHILTKGGLVHLDTIKARNYIVLNNFLK